VKMLKLQLFQWVQLDLVVSAGRTPFRNIEFSYSLEYATLTIPNYVLFQQDRLC